MDDEIGAWLGYGSYVGELRRGPDGDLYEWEEGVDGLGNPVGFWKAIKKAGKAIGRGVRKVGRGVRKVARLPGIRQALPIAAAAIPGVGPAAAAGVKAAQAAGLLGEGDYVGQLRVGPDGNLYQWEEGVDGLGNPVGFWKAIRKVGKAVGSGVRAARRVARHPLVRRALPAAAGAALGPGAASAVRSAQSAGLLGEEDLEYGDYDEFGYVGQEPYDDYDEYTDY